MDFLLENHELVCVLQPLTRAAEDWVDDNLGPETTIWDGGYVVEARDIDDIVAGITGDGLTVG